VAFFAMTDCNTGRRSTVGTFAGSQAYLWLFIAPYNYLDISGLTVGKYW